jgi:hypothetical protein
MVNVTAVLDPEGAAVLKGAVEPLSAPAPERDTRGRVVQPDPRPAAQRRADALIEIVARGVSAPGAAPSTDKAKVVVTMPYDVLAGAVKGSGTTISGDVLSPETVRRLACDAEIIPMVLGTKSEPLDLGRSRRLVTRGLRLALWQRDRGCTFPGCQVPRQWTDAHHVRHWYRHRGRTSLLNCALLCRRHHTYVHKFDLTATVTKDAVYWHV